MVKTNEPTEEKENQVFKEINTGKNVNLKLEKIVEILENRLISVLHEEDPENKNIESSEAGDAHHLVPLAIEIRSLSISVINQIEKLESILSRLELN